MSLLKTIYRIRHISGAKLFCLLISPLAPIFTVQAGQEVRIAILKTSDPIVITSDQMSMEMNGTRVDPGSSVNISRSTNGLAIMGYSKVATNVRINGSELKLNGTTHGKELRIIWENTARSDAQIVVIHSIPLDDYITGTVASEAPSSWPLEALEAQAIVARTYAVWKKYLDSDKNYHMGATVLDQVYAGLKKVTPSISEAVQRTRGQVIVFGNRPIEAYFHSACGDKTASSKEVWGTDIPYLRGTRCGFCQKASKYRWRATINNRDLTSKLHGSGLPGVHSVAVPRNAKEARPTSIATRGSRGSKTISASKFRESIGYNALPSAWITRVEDGKGAIVFSGNGYGHGVGMCQWGAYGMAISGHSAKEIIEKYYPGTEIRHLY